MIARLSRLAGIPSLLALAACSAFAGSSTSNPIARVLSPSPTETDAAPVALNAAANTLPAAAVQAPICRASQTCAALDAEQIPISCVKKVPYTNVLVPVGTTFEVVDNSADFVCLDTGVVVNDKEVLTCHGKELYSFQLRLTNAACSAAALSGGGGQCEAGYGYDAGQKCCAPVNNGASGSTVVTVSLGACP
jgi:hypothetical protein